MLYFCRGFVIWTICSDNAESHDRNPCVILPKVIICRAMTFCYTWATRSRSTCQTVFLDCSTFIAVIELYTLYRLYPGTQCVEIHLGRMSLLFTIREWGFHLRLSTNSANYFTLAAFFFSCSVNLYSLATESKVFQYQTCAFVKCIQKTR